jgi:hypothetical protein
LETAFSLFFEVEGEVAIAIAFASLSVNCYLGFLYFKALLLEVFVEVEVVEGLAGEVANVERGELLVVVC